MTVKAVEQVAAALRIYPSQTRDATFVELHLDERTVLLPLGHAQALVSMLGDRLAMAERVEVQRDERQGPRPLPERRYSSDLTIKFDVIHDVDRDELVAVVAARIETILAREGSDVWGLDLAAVPNVRETGPPPPSDDQPEDDPELAELT